MSQLTSPPSRAAAASTLVFALLVVACSSRRIEPYPRFPEPRTTAVIGVATGVSDERLADLRLGFGLSELVADALYDTGRFRLIEGRAEIRERADDLLERSWGAGAVPGTADLARQAAELGVDSVAYATITRFDSPRQKLTLGPFSTATNRLEIGVRVCLRDRPLARTFCADGAASTEASATALLFVYRDRGVVFDQTAVGAATAGAVRDAVARLTGGPSR